MLKPTGTLWVNLGDSYNANYRGGLEPNEWHKHKRSKGEVPFMGQPPSDRCGVPAKSLVGIPFRFAIEMIKRGWILRNDICWWKRNCMPRSAKDNFTPDWEHLFYFAISNKTAWWTNEKTRQLVDKQPPGTKGIEGKDWEWIDCPRCSLPQAGPNTGENNGEPWIDNNPHRERLAPEKPAGCKRCNGTGKVKDSLWHGHDYFFEQQFEPQTGVINRPDWLRPRKVRPSPNAKTEGMNGYGVDLMRRWLEHPEKFLNGRNKRCVWDITTKGSREEHYASYPEELCETPILAGCPEYICPECGKPRVKVFEVVGHQVTEAMRVAGCNNNGGYKGQDTKEYDEALAQSPSDTKRRILERMSEVTDWHWSDCGCGVPLDQCYPGTVLDPFSGTGTTNAVAKKLGRRSIGIDTSEKYCKMIARRLAKLQGVQKGLIV